MRTFSAMSVPDLILTKESYLLKLSVINHTLAHDDFLSAPQKLNFQKGAIRLRTLIDAIDAVLLSE
jgi:hypothetical protein